MKMSLLLVALPLMVLADQPQDRDPFAAIKQMERDMDAAMQRFHARMMNTDHSTAVMTSAMPMSKVDIKEVGDHYELRMDIPGATEKSINIHTRGHVVTVTTKSEAVRDENTSDHYWQERSSSSYTSSVSVPKDALPEQMKSHYGNGVLTITMPRKS